MNKFSLNSIASTKSLTIFISAIFLVIGWILSNDLIQSASNYKDEKTQLSNSLSYKKRLLDNEEWQQQEQKKLRDFNYINRHVSIVLVYESSNSQKEIYVEQQQKISEAQVEVEKKTFYLLILIFCYSLIILAVYFKSRLLSILQISSITVSLLCLYTGLMTPMLEIAAIERDLNLGQIPIKKEILGITLDLTVQKEFTGDIYFYYQSKSIMELIDLLFQQKNYVVGLSILIFSIIFPLIKTMLISYYVIKPDIAKRAWFNKYIINLSKWSMADVFVVAIFLGFLAFANLQTGIGTYSNTMVGLYFFLAYCLLSITSSMMVKRL